MLSVDPAKLPAPKRIQIKPLRRLNKILKKRGNLMRKKKLWITALTVLMLLFCFCPLSELLGCPINVEAHSGRTDANGGHRDNKNTSGLGYYHYHCGGYPAHLHSNGTCPYSAPVSQPEPPTPAKPAPKLNRSSATMYVGKTLTLKLSNASGSIIWTTNNKNIAVVNSTGKVTAKKEGACSIFAKYNRKKYRCKITVKNPFKLNTTSLTLTKGTKRYIICNMPASLATWKSSNPRIATVSKSGGVAAKSVGKCTIYAKYKGKTFKCSVTVNDKPKKYAISDITITTRDWDPLGDDVYFIVKNNGAQTIKVLNPLKVYDDDYKYFGKMEIPFNNSVSIAPGRKKEICFTDFSFSGTKLYYAQRLVFNLKIGNDIIKCYVEYTYDDETPYRFTFHSK